MYEAGTDYLLHVPDGESIIYVSCIYPWLRWYWLSFVSTVTTLPLHFFSPVYLSPWYDLCGQQGIKKQ